MKRNLLLCLFLCFAGLNVKAQEADSLKTDNENAKNEESKELKRLGFSLSFTPTSWYVLGNRFVAEWAHPRKDYLRLFAAPVIFAGLTTAYAHTRNEDLVWNPEIPEPDLFYRDRIRGYGLELGVKRRFLKRSFVRTGEDNSTFYAISAGVNRIYRNFDDADWIIGEENGLNTYKPGFVSMQDRIWQTQLHAFIGQKYFYKAFMIEGFAGFSIRYAHQKTDSRTERSHRISPWFDEAYNGFLLRIGMNIGFAAVKN